MIGDLRRVRTTRPVYDGEFNLPAGHTGIIRQRYYGATLDSVPRYVVVPDGWTWQTYVIVPESDIEVISEDDVVVQQQSAITRQHFLVENRQTYIPAALAVMEQAFGQGRPLRDST